MCDALILSFGSINWLEVIITLATVSTAVIAFLALKNWQRQDKAKREAEFLDAVIDATHAYIIEMGKPTTFLEMAKIGMASHVPNSEDEEEATKEITGAIAYIEKNGERDAKRLFEILETVQQSVIRLRSLGAKGQIFKFDSYNNCQTAIAMLTWQFDRIQAFASVIGSPTSNWQHPDIQKSLKNIMAIDAKDIQSKISENNTVLLEFGRETYQRIYR